MATHSVTYTQTPWIKEPVRNIGPITPKTAETIGLRKQVNLDLGSYNDRNDGFARSYFSRSKRNFSQIHKICKPNRIKPLHKNVDFIEWLDDFYAINNQHARIRF